MSRAVALLLLAILALESAPVRQTTAIDVVVSGADGAPPPALTPDDFEVLVGGETMPVAFVGPARPPIVALLVDVTASVKYLPQRLDDAVGGLIQTLRPGDQLRVGAFGKHLFLGAASSDPLALRKDTDRALQPRFADTLGPSPIWDALSIVSVELAKGPGPRAILLFTDGRSSGNRVSLADAIAEALTADVAIHVVLVGPPSELAAIPQDTDEGTRVLMTPGQPLGQAAAYTGGTLTRAYMTFQPELLAETLAAVRPTHRIGFAPQVRDGRVHGIEVRIRRPGLTVRARRAFVAGPARE